MTQITGIGFYNFRVFNKPTFFDLAPISILTGTNSSGKSSIFKGLLLLKDNVRELSELNFSGEKHKLGTFSIAKNKLSEGDKIGVSISFKSRANYNIVNDYWVKLLFAGNPRPNEENGYLSTLSITLPTLNSNDNNTVLLARKSKYGFETFVDLDILLGKIKTELLPAYRDYTEQLHKDKQRLKGNLRAGANYMFGVDLNNELSEYSPHDPYSTYGNVLQKLIRYNFEVVSTEKIKKLSGGASDKAIAMYSELITRSVIEHLSRAHDMFYKGVASIERTEVESFSNIFKSHIRLLTTVENINVKSLSIKEDGVFPKVLTNAKLADVLEPKFLTVCKDLIAVELSLMLSSLKTGFQQIGNIEAVRANSQRLYTNQSQGTSFNKLLLDVTQNLVLTANNEVKDTQEKKFIDEWLQKFGIGDSLNIKRIKGIATEITIQRDGNEVDLVDLGYGVTQFLPILLYIVSNFETKLKYYGQVRRSFPSDNIIHPNGPLLLIEEPESNLHPKLQSLLADFFIDVAKHFEVTLLIETHSEYLIRRLQVLTASGEVNPEHSVIYYLDGNMPSDSDKFVRKINIKPDGSLTNDFGPGFIDEATNWKMELMRLKNAQLQNLN